MDVDIEQVAREWALVDSICKWKLLEIEVLRLQQEHPQQFELLREAWSADGWVLQPPWLQSE